MQPGRRSRPVRLVGYARAAALACGLAVALMTSGCGGAGGGDEPTLVLAAASLVDVLGEVAARPDAPPFAWTVAGSEHLLRSVALGAPGDVLLIARRFTPAERELGTEPRAVCATRLVLACAATRARRPASWSELLALDPPWRLAVADPDVGPAGAYARDALAAAGATGALRPRLLVAGTVREACQLVIEGPADGVLCYRSDVTALDGLQMCFDAGGEAVVYEGLVVAPPERRAAATAVLDWLAGPPARPAFARCGLQAPP